MAQVWLKVNGKEIKLNNFVQGLISETVIGMVKSLHGVGNIETISLTVSRKAKDSQTQ
jgi:hypothetical protein